MEFRALVNQYYKNSAKLLDNFTGMWEYMMACYILLNRIMSTENKDDFLKAIERYNDFSDLLFNILRWVEERLVDETIEIDDRN